MNAIKSIHTVVPLFLLDKNLLLAILGFLTVDSISSFDIAISEKKCRAIMMETFKLFAFNENSLNFQSLVSSNDNYFRFATWLFKRGLKLLRGDDLIFQELIMDAFIYLSGTSHYYPTYFNVASLKAKDLVEFHHCLEDIRGKQYDTNIYIYIFNS